MINKIAKINFTRIVFGLIFYAFAIDADIKDVWDPIVPSEYVILRSRDTGMFALFKDAISLMQHYENGYFKAVKVDFQGGHYYEPRYGSNWWNYYFEPINYGDQSASPTEYLHLYSGEITELYNTLKFNSYIVKKYIKIKQHIEKKYQTS